MLFMLISRPKPGTTREELIDGLTQRVQPDTWDLIRHGDLSNVLFKIGDEPGFFAVLHAESLERAKAVVEASQQTQLFDLDIVPVNRFAHFD